MLFAVLKKPLLPEKLEELEGIEGFELRVDLFERIDLEEIAALRKSCSYPLLFTLRRADQGGGFQGSEIEHKILIEKLFAMEPAFFDLEYDTCPAYVLKLSRSYPAVRVIASYHSCDAPADALPHILAEMHRFPCYARKIALLAHGVLDALKMLLFARSQKRFIGISMGVEGEITRILSPVVGNLINYVPLEGEAVLGQLTARELLTTYRYATLGPDTPLFALIGDPVDKSPGPKAHNHVMEKAGVKGVYVKMRVRQSALASFFSLMRQLPFRGISVTMPLKESVLPLLDEEHAGMGAVNTLVIKEGRVSGYNTDGSGALDAIEMRRSVRGKRVIIIGAGGAAKAIAHAALERGAELLLLNRTAEKAVQLYGEKGGGLEKMQAAAERGYDILINTTPDPLPIDPRWILSEALVMDIKSRPHVTSLLAEALERGCEVVYGIEMFIHQAAAQEKLWFGPEIDEALVIQQLYSHLMS